MRLLTPNAARCRRTTGRREDTEPSGGSFSKEAGRALLLSSLAVFLPSVFTWYFVDAVCVLGWCGLDRSIRSTGLTHHIIHTELAPIPPINPSGRRDTHCAHCSERHHRCPGPTSSSSSPSSPSMRRRRRPPL